MIKIDDLKFDDNGLIPAVVVDDTSNKALTLAYMNRESLEISMREGRTCFWSRSRKTLWRKGETSGNVQTIVSITVDCDCDALVVRVNKEGPACHTGTDSCFNEVLYINGDAGNPENAFSMESLYSLIKERRDNRKSGSYTTYLFDKGIDKMLKKIGEESTEVIIAAKSGDRAETVYETADLAYHLLVLMAEREITPVDIMKELASRHVIDEKVKQERMT